MEVIVMDVMFVVILESINQSSRYNCRYQCYFDDVDIVFDGFDHSIQERVKLYDCESILSI